SRKVSTRCLTNVAALSSQFGRLLSANRCRSPRYRNSSALSIVSSFVGGRLDAVGQALRVMEQDQLAHPCPSGRGAVGLVPGAYPVSMAKGLDMNALLQQAQQMQAQMAKA